MIRTIKKLLSLEFLCTRMTRYTKMNVWELRINHHKKMSKSCTLNILDTVIIHIYLNNSSIYQRNRSYECYATRHYYNNVFFTKKNNFFLKKIFSKQCQRSQWNLFVLLRMKARKLGMNS